MTRVFIPDIAAMGLRVAAEAQQIEGVIPRGGPPATPRPPGLEVAVLAGAVIASRGVSVTPTEAVAIYREVQNEMRRTSDAG